MSIQIFADGSHVETINRLANDARISGFTTNPSLMRAAGVARYRAGAMGILQAARKKPVSIEVLADDPANMGREARGIAALAPNAVVKVPIVNSQGESMLPLITELAHEGIPLNITAVFTRQQVAGITKALDDKRGKKMSGRVIVSVFAGRIGDAGVDPFTHVGECRHTLRDGLPRAEMLWASSRQAFDITLAERAGCEITTMTPDLIAKLHLRGKDLEDYSRETAAQFHNDAKAAKYEL